ncbi:MAG: hypothetical protein HZC11_03295 [Nitrospirae bacterium]|nr:hypothetical protein [Nitrospirota bacterium]
MRIKKFITAGLFLIFALVLIIGGRVFYLQRSHFINAEKHLAKADYKLAIREYDIAMHFYVPWPPYTERSAKRLWHIGEMFEKQGRLDWANIAYSSIRSSFYASRSLYTPGKEWIKRCNEKIADLSVRMLINEGSIKSEEADTEKSKYLHALTVDRAPAPFWAVLTGISFTGWIASVLFIIFKGFDDNGKPRKVALYGVLSFILSFALWIISLIKA